MNSASRKNTNYVESVFYNKIQSSSAPREMKVQMEKSLINIIFTKNKKTV